MHYELHKNIALKRRVSQRQAELIEDGQEKVAKLEKKLEEAQGSSPSTNFPIYFPACVAYMTLSIFGQVQI